MDNLPQYADFKESLVAFVDVLGFDNKVRSISDEQSFINLATLVYISKKTADNFQNGDGILKNIMMTSISDSLIISIPFDDPVCTILMLNLLKRIQYDLLATNYRTMLRGYVCKGPVYHKGGMIFGAGYSDAYKGENQIGSFPRIVLAPNIVKEAKVAKENSNDGSIVTAYGMLLEDKSDGHYYLDFLNQEISEYLPKEQILKERAEIKKFVSNCFSEHEENMNIYSKYKWLENYLEITDHYYE